MLGGWGYMMGGWGNGGYGYSGFRWMGMGMFIPFILGIGIIILGVYVFRRNAAQLHTGAQANHSGLDILRERYARGEIDSAEYHSRKQDLEGK
ncbi:SHOCT domain-containing protein [Desulfosporosinus sp. BG]|uniref:SHOCT domain-containing protein n=1 Tax=Desulfosporosinus sp. BG TaxID=1633135 RepID=UPI000839E6A1|nr:SHOCT domain-containing protein [Desulfosporosinus sp. BG]ODA40101.1 hypothetical protein DSBG_3135 [Desulfosporosinus sp. BG]